MDTYKYMNDKITYAPTKKLKKPDWFATNGVIACCSYCGERIGNTQKYCSICKTKAGREKILEENVAILKDLRRHGYCQNSVKLLAP